MANKIQTMNPDDLGLKKDSDGKGWYKVLEYEDFTDNSVWAAFFHAVRELLKAMPAAEQAKIVLHIQDHLTKRYYAIIIYYDNKPLYYSDLPYEKYKKLSEANGYNVQELFYKIMKDELSLEKIETLAQTYEDIQTLGDETRDAAKKQLLNNPEDDKK